MKQKLALINLALDETHFRKGEDTLTLHYLSQILKEYDISLLPSRPYHKNDFNSFRKEVLPKLKENDLIGISTNTFSQYYARKFSSIVKKLYPKKEVMLGGQGIREQHPTLHIPKQLVKPVFLARDVLPNIVDIEMILTNLCPQNCGYCDTPKTQVPIPIEDYIKMISKLKQQGKKIRRMILYDNSPLHSDNFGRIKPFYEQLKKTLGYIPDSVFYCDPALLVNKKRNSEIVDFLKQFKNPNSNLFFGRECTTEYIAKKIKRRADGKVRNQDHLDRERDAILSLAKQLNTSFDFNKGLNFTLVINYILTPFETQESIRHLLEEVKQFMPYKRVLIKSTLLWVFPYTETALDYKGKFISADDMKLDLKFLNFENLNYWKEDFENALFLDLCNALHCRVYFHLPDIYNSWYNVSMVKLALDMSLKKYTKKTIPVIIEELPKDIKSLLGKKFNEFGKKIEEHALFKSTLQNKVALMRHSNKIFFNIKGKELDMLSDEYKKVLELKKKLS